MLENAGFVVRRSEDRQALNAVAEGEDFIPLGSVVAVLKTAFTTFLFLLVPVYAHAKPLHHERVYQKIWCKAHDGRMEVVLQDHSRVDCLTKDYAVEVDFAHKWREAIRQSLHYAKETGKKPGIVIIIERPQEQHFLTSLHLAIEKSILHIKVWVVRP